MVQPSFTFHGRVATASAALFMPQMHLKIANFKRPTRETKQRRNQAPLCCSRSDHPRQIGLRGNDVIGAYALNVAGR